jgi:hypothetical protein
MGFPIRSTAFAFVAIGLAATRFHPGSEQSHYDRLFPAPTGHNGYEEFALAADLSNSSKVWQDYESTGNDSLALKRRILADPLIQRTLAAVRAGLAQPIIYPHIAEEMTTLLPELRDFRSVGRLINTEMEVRFADGQTSRALDCLDDGLTFGRSVQGGALISGVVGLLVENTVLKSFSCHLSKLTLQDCDRLARIADKHLSQDDVQLGIVGRERDLYARTFRNHRSDALGLLAGLHPGPNATKADQTDFLEVREMLRHRPEDGPELMDRIVELVNAHYDAVLSALKRPVWERDYSIAEDRGSPAARLLFSLCPRSYGRTGDRFASERTLLQLVAAHAAVIRYRILHKHLPNGLDQVHLGEIGVDVFTGGPLKFALLGGKAYEISSAGPCDRDDGTGGLSGKRKPISVQYQSSD